MAGICVVDIQKRGLHVFDAGSPPQEVAELDFDGIETGHGGEWVVDLAEAVGAIMENTLSSPSTTGLIAVEETGLTIVAAVITAAATAVAPSLWIEVGYLHYSSSDTTLDGPERGVGLYTAYQASLLEAAEDDEGED